MLWEEKRRSVWLHDGGGDSERETGREDLWHIVCQLLLGADDTHRGR